MFLAVWATVSLVCGVCAGVAAHLAWPQRRDALAKPGHAGRWCRVSQSIAVASVTTLLWWLVPLVGTCFVVATVLYRRRRAARALDAHDRLRSEQLAAHERVMRENEATIALFRNTPPFI